MRIFGLLGYPLTHSFSKKYFSNKFEEENILETVYENFEVENLEGFRLSMDKVIGLAGLNVTIPYKEKVIPFLDESNEIVNVIKACNCIKIANRKWIGYNTDVLAFRQSFEPGLQPNHTKAAILGTGGASKAVAYVLKELGIEVVFVSNTRFGQGFFSYAEFTEEMTKSCPIIINTTPLGTFPDVSSYPPIPYKALTPSHYLYDLVYNPEKTQFLLKGGKYGSQIKNGAEMLQLQAEESWKLWNS